MGNYYPSSSGQQYVQNSTMAILSLIAGILGLTLFPILGSILALIFGFLARNEIQASGGMLGGGSMATTGIILGWVGVALFILGLCIAGIALLIPLCLLPLFAVSSNSSSWLPLILQLFI